AWLVQLLVTGSGHVFSCGGAHVFFFACYFFLLSFWCSVHIDGAGKVFKVSLWQSRVFFWPLSCRELHPTLPSTSQQAPLQSTATECLSYCLPVLYSMPLPF
ncbi:unnamed protein product, partial [Discosporangium mesarthrocarpum]